MSDGLREKQRLQRREAILDAAHRLLRDRDYESVTMDELAAAAGVTKPTLYAYFPTKEEVTVQSIVRLVQEGTARILGLDPGLSATERLYEIFHWALRRKFVEGNGSMSGLPVPLLRAHPDYQAAHQEMLAHLISIIREGQATGEFDPALLAELAVRPFISVVRDPEYFHLLQAQKVAPDQLVTALTAQLLNSLVKKP